MIVKLTLFDIIDILLVAVILFQLYRLIRGTAALRISIAVFFIYVFWLVVKALNMELVSTILGQVIGVGIIALFIVFQQEIRRFLLMMGNRYFSRSNIAIEKFFNANGNNKSGHRECEEIIRAAEKMADKKTGALIIIARRGTLNIFTEGGVVIDARISAELLENLFFKNSPLHDGAVLIEHRKLVAARCPLPSTEQISIPGHLGMRHRAALGITEKTDSLAVVISEETGNISVADNGNLNENVSIKELREILSRIDL